MTRTDTIVSDMAVFDDLCKEADMARAYHRITDAMGASQQLVAFINYDNRFSDAFSLGLESMDLDMQHLTIKMQLDPNAIDQLACESLRDTVIKYRKELIVAGIFVFPPALLAGIAGVVMNHSDNASAPPSKMFVEQTKCFEMALRQFETISFAVPTSGDEAAWVKLSDGLLNDDTTFAIDKISAELMTIKNSNANHPVPIEQSGWNATTYVSALRWSKTNQDRFEATQKKLSDKLETIEKHLADSSNNSVVIAKAVAKLISHTHHASKCATAALEDIKTNLTKVSHHFDEKK